MTQSVAPERYKLTMRGTMRQENQGRRRASLGLANLLLAGGAAFSLPTFAAEGLT